MAGADYADHYALRFDAYESIAALRPTMRAAVLWKAPDSSTSLKWPTSLQVAPSIATDQSQEKLKMLVVEHGEIALM
jgi:hypothetical protein